MFNFSCREAYLIENGKKTTPVKGATLIGSCMDIISNIDAVGDDLYFGSGICGKGQAAEFTAGQPAEEIAFPVKGLTIVGSTFEMLNNIDMVGTDLDLNRRFTGRTFRINLMQIRGK